MTMHPSDQKRAALAFAERIAELAKDAPDHDTKSDAWAAVNAIRRRCGFSKAEKADEVLYYIKLGASTIADLVAETKFDKNDIYAITKELEVARKIRSRNINAGEAKRPQVCYFAVEPVDAGFSPSKI